VGRHLATTNWTLIVRAEATDPEVRRVALSALCEAYWYPLYAFARRRGSNHDDAADLTQAFFVHLIDKHALRGLQPPNVRFRAFLLASFKNFEADARDRRNALKRGGGQRPVTFDLAVLERRYETLACDREDPERIYTRQWALMLLKRGRERLRASYVEAGKAREFDVLDPYLVNAPKAMSGDDIARTLEISAGAARVALHRLRRRFASALRAEVELTVGDADQVEPELRFLLAELTAPGAELSETDRAV
jgi:RNA polymerase sigma-70 factor (ECF subfamily)